MASVGGAVQARAVQLPMTGPAVRNQSAAPTSAGDRSRLGRRRVQLSGHTFLQQAALVLGM